MCAGKNMNRVLVVPMLTYNEYMGTISNSDVILDSYPFGGCNSSLEAFALGVPVVTLPSQYLNGRFTYGFYKKMGLFDLIADTKDQFVKLALRCVMDEKWRENIVTNIKNNSHKLFEENALF